MAYNECIQTVRSAAPSLSAEEAGDLLSVVADIAEEKQADVAVADTSTAVREAVQRRVDDAARAALVEKRNAALNLQARLRLRRSVDGLIDAGRAAELPDMLEAITVGQPGDSQYKQSIERSARALEGQAHALFASELRKRGIDIKEGVHFLRKRNVAPLLLKEADKPGSTGNKLAQAVAEAMEETQSFMRRTANRYGADIGEIPGYLVKQGHDPDRMRSGAKTDADALTRWTDTILPLLDHDRTFGPGMDADGKREFLAAAYRNIVMGNPADMIADMSGKPPGFKGPGNFGKRLSQRRSLHFKQDGESTWLYLQEYGQKDVASAFTGGLHGASGAIAAMMHLGPNPKYMMDEAFDYARGRLHEQNDPATAAKLDERRNSAQALFEEVAGGAAALPSSFSARGKLARTVNWTRNLTGSALLGGASLAAVADLGTASARLSNIGVPFLEAHSNMLSSIFRGRGKGERREIAHSLGVGMEGLISTVQSRWMGNDAESGQGAFLVSSVLRVTGMQWMNDATKSAAVLTLSNFIARQAKTGFEDLPDQLRRELSAYGMDATSWDAIRKGIRNVEGREYIDPEAIPDEGAARLFREFTRGFADSAVLTPGARVTGLSRRLGRRGGVLTEMAHLFLHLKSFSISYFQEHLSRFYRQGDGMQWGYAAHLTLSALVYGYIASTLKDIVAGREPRPLNDPSKLPAIFADAWATGGGAGFYGDILFAMLDRKKIPGQGLLEMTAGPGIGAVQRVVNGAVDFAAGDTTGAANEAFRLMKTTMPGANIFYSRLPLDYFIFWPMAEYIRPGFAKRFEKRAAEERGHTFWSGPVEATSMAEYTRSGFEMRAVKEREYNSWSGPVEAIEQ